MRSKRSVSTLLEILPSLTEFADCCAAKMLVSTLLEILPLTPFGVERIFVPGIVSTLLEILQKCERKKVVLNLDRR